MYANSVDLIGRLVADPIFTKGSNQEGSSDRAWGRLAVQQPKSEYVDYIPFSCWGGYARAVATHCKKGKVLVLKGRLRSRSTQKADGSFDNYMEVNCTEVYFGPDANTQVPNPPTVSNPVTAPNSTMIDPAQLKLLMEAVQKQMQSTPSQRSDEDIPF